jgi:hypothetical protein
MNKGIFLSGISLLMSALYVSAQTSVKISQYDPASSSTIVSNATEFESDLSYFTNYKGWKTNADVLHNKLPRAVRKPTDIRFLVLHESASPDYGKGFRPPNTSQFSVLRNGDILQFNDIAEVQYHASQFNTAGIGVEFVNQSWMVGRGIPAYESAMTKEQKATYAESKGYLWTFWGSGFNVYYLPDPTQLEHLYSFVTRMLKKLETDFPAIDNVYLQYVSYDDVKSVWEFAKPESIPSTEAGKAVKRYFICSSAYNYMDPGHFTNFESGILSHSVVNSIDKYGYIDEDAHPDGAFQTLYCLLRQKNHEPDEAFEKAKDLFKNSMITMRTKTNVKWREKQDGVVVEKNGKRNIYLLDLDGL